MLDALKPEHRKFIVECYQIQQVQVVGDSDGVTANRRIVRAKRSNQDKTSPNVQLPERK